MIDNASLQIEELNLLRGSYIEAIIEFQQKHEIPDIEDLWDIINPILKAKITQEFIDKNHFAKDSIHAKKNSLEYLF